MTISSLTDEQLVSTIRESNKELYSEIIRRYQNKLVHYLRKFFRDQYELEDVLQEVFIKTYRNLYAFDTEKKFSSWIYRIAHNEAINHIKKNRRSSISLDDQEWELVDDSMNIKDKIDLNIAKEKIEKALIKIKIKYREALILYFFEQKSYDEISDILQIPKSTVGTLIMRGKNMLKDLLEEK